MNKCNLKSNSVVSWKFVSAVSFKKEINCLFVSFAQDSLWLCLVTGLVLLPPNDWNGRCNPNANRLKRLIENFRFNVKIQISLCMSITEGLTEGP